MCPWRPTRYLDGPEWELCELGESLQQQWRVRVLRPALTWIGLWSAAAERLLYGTAMHESAGLLYVRQMRGPALGPYQMEPATLTDLLDNWLAYRSQHRQWLDASARNGQRLAVADPLNLLDPVYATVAARLQYLRMPDALPDADDLRGLAQYYKRHWNTQLGKATEQDFIEALTRYEEP